MMGKAAYGQQKTTISISPNMSIANSPGVRINPSAPAMTVHDLTEPVF